MPTLNPKQSSSPNSPAILAAPKKPKKRRVRKRVTFDFDRLPASAWLTTTEVAAVLRRASGTVEMWRQKQPDHALKWERVDGKPLYRVAALRAYIAAQDARLWKA
jgi:hypothetical protein